jgi:tripartite-type tricarboxylate transporter receptor subunit TctC
MHNVDRLYAQRTGRNELKRVVLCAGALLMAAGTALAAQTISSGSGQAYPTRPIRMIVPFNPGGTSDTIARIFGQKVTEAWGQPVVVDIRPGASGIIGTEIAARAPGDGYTLLHGNLSQFATNPSLYRLKGATH